MSQTDPNTIRLVLKDEAATLRMGAVLGRVLGELRPIPSLLLTGPLGAGKTTLVRGLAESLPGAHAAEVASPSFNIYNVYPTTPEVIHADLYRLDGMPIPEDLDEELARPDTLGVIEWAEHMPEHMRPDPALFLEITPHETLRSVKIKACGGDALAALNMLRPEIQLIEEG